MRCLSERFDLDGCNDFTAGQVVWAPIKSLWWTLMTVSWLIGGIAFCSWGAVAVFFAFSGIILCGGHPIGMHRKFIHQSFECPKWLEYFGLYLGTLVGLGGPLTMMKTHDMRDWAQRQSLCHDYYSHGRSLGADFIWQVHCGLKSEQAPQYTFPKSILNDRVVIALQRTAMLQQLPLALFLFWLGGWGFVFWGICGRISVSILGHWFIGYFAHNQGSQDWVVEGAAVQGYNVRFCGWVTFGECWHNNHHAFPESARLGLYKGQSDPGWWVLSGLEKMGLVYNIVGLNDLPSRNRLKAL